jgi:hypothetical protein
MGIKDIPREENCSPAYDSPEVYYMKILTTKGFESNQKLDAALAYADWLDFKGLQGTAGDMYSWAMDIAAAGLPVDVSQVVDLNTGVLKEKGSEFVSENLLRASTALGVHHVRRGDLPTALSVFLSVLRARRDLPSPPPPTELPADELGKSLNQDNFSLSEIARTITSYIFPHPYPVPRGTGNDRPVRSLSSSCEEAGIMVYIGEIIFASSSQEDGLAWTRDAVDMAESAIMQLGDEEEEESNSRSTSILHSDIQTRCQDCLRVGLNNWKKMIRTLVVKAENEELESMDRAKNSWFGGAKRVKEKELQRRRWEAEEMILEDRTKRLRRALGDPGFAGFSSESSMLVM